MAERFQTISPGDGTVLLERSYADDAQIDRCLQRAVDSVPAWRAAPLADRIAQLRSFVACFVARSEELALELRPA